MKNIAIIDNWNHIVASGKQFERGFLDLNFKVKRYFNIHDLSNENFDLIIFCGQIENANQLEKFIKIKKNNTKCIIMSCVHSNTNVNLLPNYKDCIDFTFNYNKSLSWAKNISEKNNIRFVHLPHSSDDKLFFPIKEMEKIIDFSFIGSFSHGDRKQSEYLFPIYDKYPELKHHSYGFNYKNINNGKLNYESLNKIYNETKVNINFHYDFQKSDKGLPNSGIQFNTRTYDIAMAGQFQMCDSSYVIEDFENTIAYVEKSEWLESFYKFQHDEKTRKKFTENAREVSLRKHSCKARMVELCHILNWKI